MGFSNFIKKCTSQYAGVGTEYAKHITQHIFEFLGCNAILPFKKE